MVSNAPGGAERVREDAITASLSRVKPSAEFAQMRRRLAEFERLRALAAGNSAELRRRLALISANIESAEARLDDDSAGRVARKVAIFMTLCARAYGQQHRGEPGNAYETKRDIWTTGRRIVDTVAETGALERIASGDARIWFLNRLAMRIATAAAMDHESTDYLARTLVGAGIDRILEHAPDAGAAFAQMFPTDTGKNYDEADQALDIVAGKKFAPMLQIFRLVEDSFGYTLPKHGSLGITYRYLTDKFMTSGAAGLVPPRSPEEADARTYDILARASELRRVVLVRPLDGLPDIECTDFVRSRVPSVGGVSIKEAVLRQDKEDSGRFVRSG